jgi:hypothetical protein
MYPARGLILSIEINKQIKHDSIASSPGAIASLWSKGQFFAAHDKD